MLYGVTVYSHVSVCGVGVLGDSKSASESIEVLGFSCLFSSNPKIQGTCSLQSDSKNDGLFVCGVVVALGSLRGVAGTLCPKELVGNVGNNWIPQRLAKLSQHPELQVDFQRAAHNHNHTWRVFALFCLVIFHCPAAHKSAIFVEALIH